MEILPSLVLFVYIFFWALLGFAFVYILVQQIRRMRREHFHKRDN